MSNTVLGNPASTTSGDKGDDEKSEYWIKDQDGADVELYYNDLEDAEEAAAQISDCGVYCFVCNEGASSRFGCGCTRRWLEEARAVVEKDKAEKAAVEKALKRAKKKLREVQRLIEQKQTRDLNTAELEKVLKHSSFLKEVHDLAEKLGGGE